MREQVDRIKQKRKQQQPSGSPFSRKGEVVIEGREASTNP